MPKVLQEKGMRPLPKAFCRSCLIWYLLLAADSLGYALLEEVHQHCLCKIKVKRRYRSGWYSLKGAAEESCEFPFGQSPAGR